MINIQQMWTDDYGQDIVEYGLIAMLIATALVALVQGFGTPVAAAWSAFAAKFASAF